MSGRDRELVRARAILDALTEAADEAGIGVSISYLTQESAELAYTNPGAAKLLGVSLEEFKRRPVWSFSPPEELPRLAEMHARRLRGEKLPSTYGTVLIRGDGSRLPVEIASSRIQLDGRSAAVTFVFDATHREQAQATLARSEADFRALAEGAPDGIAILRWPVIAYVNRVAAAMLGFESPAQAVGADLLERLTPIDDEVVVRGPRRDDEAGVSEYTVADSMRVVEVSTTPIEFAGAPATLAFARDVTERKALVARLMETEKLAAVGTLAAGVAHEINNPLAYMLLNVDLVIRQLPKVADDPTLIAGLLERLEQVRHGGARVKTIVSELQTFTRRDDGEHGPVQLSEAVEAALGIAAHELRQSVSVVRRFAPVPPVLGNTTRFEQLFLNLILNAVHAVSNVEQARHVIEIELRPEGEATVLASVHDCGSGMSSDTLARAFEPFFTTKALGEGTGLGLAICRNIVRAANGELRLRSTPGEGTTVELRFPAHHVADPVRQRDPVTIPPATPERRGTILVIDDEPAIVASIRQALSDEHDVMCCDSSVAARELLRSGRRFDVVLCDLVMPVVDGTALYEDARSCQPELASRFVFMTGGVTLPHVEHFLATIDNPRLLKPFDLAMLRRLLRDMLA